MKKTIQHMKETLRRYGRDDEGSDAQIIDRHNDLMFDLCFNDVNGASLTPQQRNPSL